MESNRKEDRQIRKFLDTLQEQAKAIDAVIQRNEIIVSEINNIGENMDMLSQAIHQMTVTQEEMLKRLIEVEKSISERTTALVELCIKTSNRVDDIERVITNPSSCTE